MVKADRPPVVDPAEWAQVVAAQKKGNKYHAEAFTDAEGVRWHSRDEFERWGLLKTMLWAGLIRDLRRQVSYVLQPAFRDARGHRVRAISLVVDFEYLDADGRLVVEDFKGFETATWKMKQKMFRAKYPDIELRVSKKDGKR